MSWPDGSRCCYCCVSSALLFYMQLRIFGLLLCAIMNVRVYVSVCVEYLLQLGAGRGSGHGNEARDWGILKIYVEICASKIQNTAHRSTERGYRGRGEETKHILYAYEMLIQSLF